MENLKINEIPSEIPKMSGLGQTLPHNDFDENTLPRSGIPSSGMTDSMWDTQNDFASVGKAKMDSLKDVVVEIEQMIDERNQLSGRFIKEGESMKQSINNFLLESAPKGEDDSEFARERSELRKKQLDISELQLNEKVGCWRDISLLKRELREHNLQINEKTSRAEMFEKILTE